MSTWVGPLTRRFGDFFERKYFVSFPASPTSCRGEHTSAHKCGYIHPRRASSANDVTISIVIIISKLLFAYVAPTSWSQRSSVDAFSYVVVVVTVVVAEVVASSPPSSSLSEVAELTDASGCSSDVSCSQLPTVTG